MMHAADLILLLLSPVIAGVFALITRGAR